MRLSSSAIRWLLLVSAVCYTNTAVVPSPRLQYLRTVATGASVGGNLQDPTSMRDPDTGLWHMWTVTGTDGTCGWAGHIRHFYSSNASLETAAFIDGGIALNHSADPAALDSNGMFSPGIMRDPDDNMWYLFYSATGKGGDAGRQCIGEPTACVSSQQVARAASPHGPWQKLGTVSLAKNDSKSWNERLVDCGRPLIVNGTRAYFGLGFVSTAREQAGAVSSVEGVYLPHDPASWVPPYVDWPRNPLETASDLNVGPHKEGYENCEFVPHAGRMHVLCTDHHHGQCYDNLRGSNVSCVAHFVASDASVRRWDFVEHLNTRPALEATPVYDGVPGDAANVTHFVARTIDPDCHSPPRHNGCQDIGLYALSWA